MQLTKPLNDPQVAEVEYKNDAWIQSQAHHDFRALADVPGILVVDESGKSAVFLTPPQIEHITSNLLQRSTYDQSYLREGVDQSKFTPHKHTGRIMVVVSEDPRYITVLKLLKDEMRLLSPDDTRGFIEKVLREKRIEQALTEFELDAFKSKEPAADLEA